MSLNLRTHPILSGLLNRKLIFIDEGANEYVGITPDGTNVWIGTVGREDNLEEYLEMFPNPSDW